MTTTNLGRVQGAGFFFANVTSATSVNKTDLIPSTIPALVGDHVIFPNGDIRKITAVGSTTITCDTVSANLRGPQGPLPTDAVHYDLETTETTEGVLLDGYYTKAQTLELIANAGSSKANINLNNVTVPSNTPGEITQGSGDRIVETYISSDGKTWYRRWASGWKECGVKISQSSWNYYDIALPITFSNVNTMTIMTNWDASISPYVTSNDMNSSTIGISSYTVNSVNAALGGKHIYVCGY